MDSIRMAKLVSSMIWYFNVCSWQGGDISSLEAKLTLTLGRIFLICWPLLEIMGAILHQHYIIGSLWPPLISSDAALWHSQDGNHAWSSMGYTFTSNPAQSWQGALYVGYTKWLEIWGKRGGFGVDTVDAKIYHMFATEGNIAGKLY